MAPIRRIYPFAQGKSDGDKSMKELLGGKGANLCEMAKCGLAVPPGFSITTEVCQEFHALGGKLPEELLAEIKTAVAGVEADMGLKFGDPKAPLLFSVRSGAAVSMPGMMDTVLNLGLNDTIVEGFAAARGERFAMDCYRRLLQMFGDVVLGIPHEEFESKLTGLKAARGVQYDVQLTADDLRQLVKEYKEVYKHNNLELPQDPWEQMYLGVTAVFKSWNIPRAIKYREINKITGLKGTAVNVQTMVFGNYGDTSGTGVCFTRNPANGDRELFGEFLINAQGEDVVAGIRTPMPIKLMNDVMPPIYAELVANTTMLEKHMKDMQDVEFTVQEGRLFMLQCRNGKRTGTAALRIALDLEAEGLITMDEAVCMVEPRHLDQLLHPQFEDEKKYAKDVLTRGLAASPGAAVGRLVFSAEEAEEWKARGERVVLCRHETSPEDVGGMHVSEGIVTARGGMTSHAAVVARGWGKPCVCGCEALQIDLKNKTLTIEVAGKDVVLKEGDWVSLNGTTGEVIKGQQGLKKAEVTGGDLGKLMAWVDKTRHLRVLTNCDTPEDALVARQNGAQGIGLCRTEHMFFATPERIAAVRRMIAEEELDSSHKLEALEDLKKFQREDFEGIFRAMDGLPVTIRLLDPPLHEFLPQEGPAMVALCKQLALELKTTVERVEGRLNGLREVNPMMGLRGCRLGIVHPEITEMQATAIFEAAVEAQKKGAHVHPHIMVPLVATTEEMDHQLAIVRNAATAVQAKAGVKINYKVGTMIEVPRAALQAGKLAERAEFFSFGTNDLTQMTFGISRDDAQAKFLSHYTRSGILVSDPFDTLDQVGVGEMVKIAVERGRAVKPDLELGICGEHGGDPASIAFFHKVGLDYVSCSPLRVPIARLAAAQAQIKNRK
ncbi:hypothetical protein HYH03_004156 [Edaphochlamys debaryana]|uniref:Pyruvate, phosphate dikinase n=1 Tax=Edaphochlamys debaryana TaxID=47281 RepID=A0A836C2I7_9CHLO|nr:hypothetical protein HYH03_004156 [Edaphochlamys debaryana]|eukprot:KAG2497890.1 hypothetical protein HYH03_004156 [Edaphochlamys debaryana]